MAPRANREYFRVRLQGFSVINLIALAIIVVCMVAGTESARETKSVKTSRSNKEKEKCVVRQDEKNHYFVECGVPGEKGKKKGKGANSSGDNKKRPTNQCPSECRGKRGQRGQRGRAGPKGQPGSKGPRGPPGDDGRDGVNGMPGLKGSIGPIGTPGLQGPPGIPGDKGTTGAQGPRGPSGLQGLPGIPGNCVTSSSSNTTITPVFCLPGKPGIKGARGETGKRGSQGPQGSRGNKGSRGSRGSQGPPGKIGDPGPPGDFAGLTCLPRYTGWVDRGDWLSEQPEVHCDRREFLQGFSMEENKARGQRRFKYTCCALRLTIPGEG